MVKLTIVGRVSDGLALAQGPMCTENHKFLTFYKQQAEFIVEEISRATLAPTKMTILVDHHSFHYLVGNGICFITLCDSSYPRKLAFHFLQDLQKEFHKLEIGNNTLFHKIIRPYSFLKFGRVIGNIGKQYVDTRTQANLSKLNANRQKDTDILTIHISEILEKKRLSEISEIKLVTSQTVSSIWCSPILEAIALKWMPITVVFAVTIVLIWSSLMLKDEFIISNL